MTSIVSLFDKVVKESPDDISYYFNDHKIEFGKLAESVNRFANGLSDLGVLKVIVLLFFYRTCHISR